MLVLIEAGILAYTFGKNEIRSVETYILEALSKRVQTKAEDLAHSPNTFRLGLDAKEDKLPEFFTRALLSPLLPPSGSAVTTCKNIRGESFYCGFAFVPEMKVWAFDFVEEETLMRAVLRRLEEVAPFILLLLIASLALTFILSKFLLAPLRRFATASEVIAEGRYEEVSLPLDRRDEVGDLAQAFKKMIADLKEREINLQLSGEKLAHSARLASLGQMGASIAHEVKNPLTSMMGYAKVLMNKSSDPEVKEAAEVIQKESERCNQILQQMLRFARNDPKESKPYSLKEVLLSVLLLLKAEARSRQIELKAESILDSIVLGSAQQVQQVLINLIMNAFHASKSGMQVTLRMREENSKVIVEVEDHGAGIPADIQPKIFDPFFTTKSKIEGTGLGLSVAQEIVMQEGGTLSFTSEDGKGSIFRISLPLP
ncbi:MAG: putative signal transduction histidine kinase [Bacteriovoracaceae bacterium]|nr:putative signal transduction histidine kinase [Bacteriovoracaceae bacterium]